jgi:hypothetical protein
MIKPTARLGLASLALALCTAAAGAYASNSAFNYGQYLNSNVASGNTVVARAEFYVSRVFAANNSYTTSNQTGGGQITIDYVSNGLYAVNARVVCGSFVSRVHRLTHGLTGNGSQDPNDTMNRLFGAGLPNASQWYDGIVAARAVDQGTGASLKHVSVVQLANPMVANGFVGHNVVLASRYTIPGEADTGHAMIAASWAEDAPAAGFTMPAGATRRWRVRIFDSTKTSHYDGVSLATDSREQGESGPGFDGVSGTSDDNDDNGIGEASIHVFSNDAGAIIAWTWTLADANIYTQSDRPMVAGEMIVTQ